MKRLILLLTILLALPAHAQFIITGSISVTNPPLGNTNTVTVAGSTRTFTNTVSASPGSLIQQTNSITRSATNIWLHFATYPAHAAHTPTIGSLSNKVNIRGYPGELLTISVSAGWAAVSYVTNTLSSAIVVRVPHTVEAATNQTNIASMLVPYLDKSTNALATNSPALTNHVGLTTVQTITGHKTFLGTNAFTNSVWHGGYISNAQAYLSNAYLVRPTTTNLTNYGAAISSPGTGTNSQQFAGGAATGSNTFAFGGGASGIGAANFGAGSALGNYSLSLASGPTGNNVNGDRSIGIGGGDVDGNDSLGIGLNYSISGSNNVAIGNNSGSSFNFTVALGCGATPTANNQLRFGRSTETNSFPGYVEMNGVNKMTFVGSVTNDAKWSTPAYSFTTLANGNNIAIDFGSNAFVRLDGSVTADSAICGIIGGYDGVTYEVLNNTGYTITFAQNTVDPTPANRFDTFTGADTAVPYKASLVLRYNGASSRWNIANIWPSASVATSLTWDLGTQTATDATNHVADFGVQAKLLTASAHINFLHSTNRAAARLIPSTIIIEAGNTNRHLAFNASWKFLAAAAPTLLASNKVAELKLTSYGASETNVLATYTVQP